MKKTLSFMSIVLTILLFANCSHNESEYIKEEITEVLLSGNNQNEEESLAQLQMELTNLNNSYKISDTRGKKWWKWLCVGLTDGMGWAIGKWWGAAAGSCVAYALLFHCDFEATFQLFRGVPMSAARSTRFGHINNPLLPDSLYSGVYSDVGIIHNQLIYNVFGDSVKLNNYYNGDSLQKVDIILNEYEAIADTNLSVNSQTKLAFANTSMIVAHALDNSTTEEGFVSILKTYATDLGTTSSLIDLFYLYMKGIEDAGNQKAQYMNDALRLVDKSNLSPVIKKDIENKMIIGHASYCLIEEIGLQ